MKNKILYSPWRLDYILSNKDKKCIFCLKPEKNEDEKQLIIYRSEFCFVIMNLYPYNNGHLMVIPNRHVSSLVELNKKELNNLFENVQLTEKVMREVYNPDGLNVGINIGSAAGAGIESHLHVHIVPRWNGDNNFMSTIGGTRTIPEAFNSAYHKLKDKFDRITEGK